MTSFLNEKRRLYDRFPSRFPVKFKDTRSEFGADVHLSNFSAAGVKISTKEQLYINDSVNLEVDLPDGKGPMKIRGEVTWAVKLSDKTWDVGLKFHKVVFMDEWRIYRFIENSSII